MTPIQRLKAGLPMYDSFELAMKAWGVPEDHWRRGGLWDQEKAEYQAAEDAHEAEIERIREKYNGQRP